MLLSAGTPLAVAHLVSPDGELTAEEETRNFTGVEETDVTILYKIKMKRKKEKKKQTKPRVNLTHILAERWGMRKEAITQHLGHAPSFPRREELVLRENLVPVTGKPGPHTGRVRCSPRAAELLVIDRSFHLCVLTDLSATLGPRHQTP